MKNWRNPEEKRVVDKAFENNQGQLLQFWGELNDSERDLLIQDLKKIDFYLLERVKPLTHGNDNKKRDIEPPELIEIPKTSSQIEEEREAYESGVSFLQNSKVACFTAAGGQSSRLGLDIPKGAYPITPVMGKSLFQVHAEKIVSLQKKFKAAFPWIIMVSETNRDETCKFFKSNNFFGLNPEYVRFIEQGMFPAIDESGKIFLKEKHRIFLSPTGHGGFFSALRDSGAISWLKELGISEIFYFQVDNVLVKILDPVFIGYHLQNRCEMSSKSVSKRNPQEKMGVFVKEKGKNMIVEYSELQSCGLPFDEINKFSAGNIAIHIVNLKFASGENVSGLELPFHIAHKAIPHINEEGEKVLPQKSNGYKFETFIFDALRDVERSIVMEVKRDEEFSPLKNRSGSDSPETVLKDQILFFARWFESANINVPFSSDGYPLYKLEVSPLFAFFEKDFLEKIERGMAINRDTYIA